MTGSVNVRIPVEPRYRALATEVAGKFVELIGGSPTDAQALSDALSTALDGIAPSTEGEAHVDLTFHAGTGGVEVAVRCGARSAVVKQPLPARKA